MGKTREERRRRSSRSEKMILLRCCLHALLDTVRNVAQISRRRRLHESKEPAGQTGRLVGVGRKIGVGGFHRRAVRGWEKVGVGRAPERSAFGSVTPCQPIFTKSKPSAEAIFFSCLSPGDFRLQTQ
ncbi:hypothetical protein N7540_003337 [Penicillium herquei]|nr:hypothetical protein N7540_003337 [Penicillium herquei]